MTPILKVEQLGKSFGAVNALNGLTLSVEKGQVVGILGPNGSGKTTLLSLILGVKAASSGTFCWFGQPNGQLVNTRLGALLEAPYFYPYLSLEKNLEITALSRGCGLQGIAEVLHRVNLYERRKASCYTLSLGMKQRLALAQALLGNPEVIVLDEPTNGLDPEGIADVRAIIREQAALGKTVIVASHNLDEVQKTCSHAIILKSGKCIAHGRVEELLRIGLVAMVETHQTTELSALLGKAGGCKILERNIAGFVLTFDCQDNVSGFSTLLASHGITLNRFEVRQPTLEELFLSIVKQANP